MVSATVDDAAGTVLSYSIDKLLRPSFKILIVGQWPADLCKCVSIRSQGVKLLFAGCHPICGQQAAGFLWPSRGRGQEHTAPGSLSPPPPSAAVPQPGGPRRAGLRSVSATAPCSQGPPRAASADRRSCCSLQHSSCTHSILPCRN